MLQLLWGISSYVLIMRSRKFVKRAEYPGGSKALKSFINNNLRYPKSAIENKIEGSVYVKYEINERSEVHSIFVVKKLGYGCDEEAIRLVSLLDYSEVKNRGVKVNTKFRITINFILPKNIPLKINYIVR